MARYDMSMQCGPVESDQWLHSRCFCLYNTGMKQLLMYLREKTLQERQQALFLEFHGKDINCYLHISCWHQQRKRKLLIDQYDHRLEVYALHVIIQMHSHN